MKPAFLALLSYFAVSCPVCAAVPELLSHFSATPASLPSSSCTAVTSLCTHLHVASSEIPYMPWFHTHVVNWHVCGIALTQLSTLLGTHAGMLLISEWWASEIMTILGGLLPDAERQLSAIAIYTTTNAMCFMLSLGLAAAVSTR